MTTRMALLTPHAGADSLSECLASWDYPHTYILDGKDGMLVAMDRGWRERSEEIIAFFHDDLLICKPSGEPDNITSYIWDEGQTYPIWVDRVLKEFDNPKVGLVGFGGALQHGSPDLYRVPYDLHQLGRTDYRSNVEDAEVHGAREERVVDVAVLDGFALIVRRQILERAGGWPLASPISYIGYDYWLSCIVRRYGYRIRMVGVRCLHMGGRTVVALKRGGATGDEYHAAHRYIYQEFADVLPFRAETR